MKKIIGILIILIMVSCTKITVLEVKNVKDVYRVTYQNKAFLSSQWVTHTNFYTMNGVNNFIVEIADKDLSQWRSK